MSLPGQAEDHNELSPDCAGCTEDTLPAEPDALRRKAALGCLVLPGQRQACEMCHGSRPRMGKSPGHTLCGSQVTACSRSQRRLFSLGSV